MKRELSPQFIGQIFVWQLVVSSFIGWDGPMLADEWTNWNLLSFGCQILLLACAWRAIRRWEQPVPLRG
jgi:hypothetical protein